MATEDKCLPWNLPSLIRRGLYHAYSENALQLGLGKHSYCRYEKLHSSCDNFYYHNLRGASVRNIFFKNNITELNYWLKIFGMWLSEVLFSLAYLATKSFGFFFRTLGILRYYDFLKLSLWKELFLSFRNPNGRNRPWCYTKRGSAIQETPCNIEKCGK